MFSNKLKIISLVKVCPGKAHAWYNTEAGLKRKPIISKFGLVPKEEQGTLIARKEFNPPITIRAGEEVAIDFSTGKVKRNRNYIRGILYVAASIIIIYFILAGL